MFPGRSFGKIYLLFPTVNLVKRNLCENLATNGRGEGTFCELVSSGIRVNSLISSSIDFAQREFSRKPFKTKSYRNCCDSCFFDIFIRLTRKGKVQCQALFRHIQFVNCFDLLCVCTSAYFSL